MDTAHQSHLAFHLTSRLAGPGLEPVNDRGLDLRPAALAPYRDLTSLRYDFPLVLVEGDDASPLRPLSAVINALLRDLAKVQDADRLAGDVLRLERELRTIVAGGATGTLTSLWDQAAARLGVRTGTATGAMLDRARGALAVDGVVVDCASSFPSAAVAHVWRAAQRAKAARFRHDVGALAQRLSDILRADFVRSDAGRSPAQLRARVGTLYESAFDFDALSRTLATAGSGAMLSESRRHRLQQVLKTLDTQPFYPAADADDAPGAWASLQFDRCSAALEAFRARQPQMLALARAVGIAELEVAGEYREDRHEAFFRDFTADSLAAQDLAVFPDTLVCASASTLDPIEQAALLEILSSGLPIKVLIQFDDLADAAGRGGPTLGLGARARQLTTMAMGLNEVFVLQASASHLYRQHAGLAAGLHYPGPALFSVFSGAITAGSHLPPYLTAAAATASRVFPVFTFDPSAGADWASRFSLDGNPEVDRDWPSMPLAYEDDAQQRVDEDLVFTAADFLAADPRQARHLARIPRADWTGPIASVSEAIAAAPRARIERVPAVLLVDGHDRLHRAIVDDQLLRETRRVREAWHSLQELGGIHNSHAERLVAKVRAEHAEERRAADAAAHAATAPAASVSSAPAAAGPASAAPSAAVAEPAKSNDDPFIETPRCTTCNECTRVNPNMFAYNENKQAYIKNPDAGPYRQLVEAAESCQVSIIHPGEPRNPNEPGLEELIERAKLFT